MLITNELTRDVLCNELIELDKCIKSNLSKVPSELSEHIYNMISILMDDKDMVQVNVDAWIPDLTKIAEAIASQRGR